MTENNPTTADTAQQQPTAKEKKQQKKQDAKSRLSDALRANLRRRKDQTRARNTD